MYTIWYLFRCRCCFYCQQITVIFPVTSFELLPHVQYLLLLHLLLFSSFVYQYFPKRCLLASSSDTTFRIHVTSGAIFRSYPQQTRKHVIITSKRRFDVIITCLLRCVFAESLLRSLLLNALLTVFPIGLKQHIAHNWAAQRCSNYWGNFKGFPRTMTRLRWWAPTTEGTGVTQWPRNTRIDTKYSKKLEWKL